MTPRTAAFIAAGGALVADQLTKWWAVETLSAKNIGLIDGFLQLRLVRNSGGAFGLFRGGGAVLALAAIAATAIIMVGVRRIEVRSEGVALGLILGGAVGNLIDRIFRGNGLLDGHVVDFVDFDFFPTFNVADTAITIGAILALGLAFFRE